MAGVIESPGSCSLFRGHQLRHRHGSKAADRVGSASARASRRSGGARAPPIASSTGVAILPAHRLRHRHTAHAATASSARPGTPLLRSGEAAPALTTSPCCGLTKEAPDRVLSPLCSPGLIVAGLERCRSGSLMRRGDMRKLWTRSGSPTKGRRGAAGRADRRGPDRLDHLDRSGSCALARALMRMPGVGHQASRTWLRDNANRRGGTGGLTKHWDHQLVVQAAERKEGGMDEI